MKEVLELLHMIKSDVGMSLISLSLLALFIVKNFNSIISYSKDLYSLKKRKLKEIISNDNIHNNTKKLADIELNAIYNYEITGVSYYKLREPLVTVIIENGLPARYFKTFTPFLGMDKKEIKINERKYRITNAVHAWVVIPFFTMLLLSINAAVFMKAGASMGFYFMNATLIVLMFFFFITKPPFKKQFSEMKLYVEKYNKAQNK
jgi:hypothetical protein